MLLVQKEFCYFASHNFANSSFISKNFKLQYIIPAIEFVTEASTQLSFRKFAYEGAVRASEKLNQILEHERRASQRSN